MPYTIFGAINLTTLLLRSFITFTFLFFSSQYVFAQNEITQTKVSIKSGLADDFNLEIEQKIESLLISINELTFNEVDQFSDTDGEAVLQEIVQERKFISNLDEINTFIITTQDNSFEVPQIYLRPIDGNEFSYEELKFTFSEDGKLLNAQIADKQKNIERITRRSSFADDEETKMVQAAVESYTKAFSDKDINTVKELFTDSSTIITGSKRLSDGVIDYNRYSYESYMKRLEERVLTSYNTVDIKFEDEEIYRHPDFRTSYGFYAKQFYQTPSYADTGYIFIIWDFDSSKPTIVSRTWQNQSFELSSFSEVAAPKPRRLEARLTDVRTRVDNSNLSLTKSMPRDQGLLQIELETNDLSLINTEIANEWIDQQILTFTNLELLTNFIEIIDSTNIRIPFKTEWEQGMQRITTDLNIRGTSVIDDFSSTQPLYLQRLNVMTVRILSRQEQEEVEEKERAIAAGEIEPEAPDTTEYAFAEQFVFEGKVNFKTNISGFNIRIMDEGDNVLYDEVQNRRRFSYQLLEGPYKVEFSGEDIDTRVIELLILKTEILQHALVLR